MVASSPSSPSSPNCKSCQPAFPRLDLLLLATEPTGNTRRILVASCRRHLLTRLSIADKPRWKQPSYARPPRSQGWIGAPPSSYFAAVAFPEMGPPFVGKVRKLTRSKWYFGPRSVYPSAFTPILVDNPSSFCPMVVRAKARRRDAPAWRGRIVALPVISDRQTQPGSKRSGLTPH